MRSYLEAQGAVVEPAHNVVVWMPGPGGRIPRSIAHDLFGIWDGVYVTPTVRGFYQVTDVTSCSAKRRKILASGFPVTPQDLIALYIPRRGFRVLRGPEFAMEPSEQWVLSAATGGVAMTPWAG